MSLPPDSAIYTGPWINWARGSILGSTITLTQRDGQLLTAFLSLLVTLAGGACWRVLSFLIHQHRAKRGCSDAVQHQQQVLLRNCSSPAAAAWQMIQVALYWRKIANRSIMRGLPLILLAIGNMVLFAIAGVFSADFTNAGNKTLIQSPTCGYLLPDANRTDSPLDQATTDINAKDANDTLNASAYTRACYRKTQSGAQCYQYPKPNIP